MISIPQRSRDEFSIVTTKIVVGSQTNARYLAVFTALCVLCSSKDFSYILHLHKL
jgi:hypothetical protein